MNKELYFVKAEFDVQVHGEINLIKEFGQEYLIDSVIQRESLTTLQEKLEPLADWHNFCHRVKWTGYVWLDENSEQDWMNDATLDGGHFVRLEQDLIDQCQADFVITDLQFAKSIDRESPELAELDIRRASAGEEIQYHIGNGCKDGKVECQGLFENAPGGGLRVHRLVKVQEQESEKTVSESDVVKTLVQLRRDKDSLGMRAAGLFKGVKDNFGAYKAQFGSFRAFCTATTWHFTTVYDLIRVYENPALREAYVDIGQMKAVKIAKSGLEDVSGLVEFARDHTAKELSAEIADRKNDSEPEVEEDSSLNGLLDKEAALLSRKEELESELDSIRAELAKVHEQVKSLSQ